MRVRSHPKLNVRRGLCQPDSARSGAEAPRHSSSPILSAQVGRLSRAAPDVHVRLPPFQEVARRPWTPAPRLEYCPSCCCWLGKNEWHWAQARPPHLLCKGRSELSYHPGQIFARNDERRGQADHELVRLLAEHAQVFQTLAVTARRNRKLDADQQPAA